MTKLITSAHDGDLPMGNGLCQLLADRNPEAQPERVQDHEEHAEPVDQVGQIGLRHVAPSSLLRTVTSIMTPRRVPRRLTGRRRIGPAPLTDGASAAAHMLDVERVSAVRGAAFRESLMKVGYVVLYVNDAEACRRFWVEQIGMVEKRRVRGGRPSRSPRSGSPTSRSRSSSCRSS